MITDNTNFREKNIIKNKNGYYKQVKGAKIKTRKKYNGNERKEGK